MSGYRVFLFTILLIAPLNAAADEVLWSKLYEPGHFAIMRHTTAPGTGDPGNFKIGDCSTQRNLNDIGAREAQAIGRAIRAGGIKSARVYSSQWCRCLDTASQLNLGPVTELPALNSFYQRYDTKMVNLRALRRFIAANATSDEPVILVTHQVNISALTGQHVRQGETIIFRHVRLGEVEVVGAIPPT